ncbi:hypothetical protein L1887_36033 [Cichorium endivia]|nr:hypothetical protein L1887_36033 [Cichorium endivia]
MISPLSKRVVDSFFQVPKTNRNEETWNHIFWDDLRYFNVIGSDPDGRLGEAHDQSYVNMEEYRVLVLMRPMELQMGTR